MSATKLRRVALAAICPPVASVSDSPSKRMSPPETISMRDWSRRSDSRERLSKSAGGTSARAASCAADSLISASRWLSSALALPSSSISTAVTAPLPTATLPRVSAAEFSRCTVPRTATVEVASATPSWRTSRPASVMSPSRATMRPVLRTVPAVLSAANCGAISLPRVVEKALASVPMPLRITKLSPAASCAWPLRAAISPALATSLPSSST
ncbi:hypothetical protein D9M68_403130 [compost metagenome]